MGDVFDAMNRSNKERDDGPEGKPAAQGDHAPEPTPDKPEQGGLPIDDVDATPVIEEQPERQAPATPRREQPAPPPPIETQRPTRAAPVAAASDRFQQEQDAQERPSIDEIDPITGAHVGLDSLNGYSADVVVHHDRGSIITEQYRAIRTQILARARNRRVQTHVITSSAPEEGKSVTTVNLGIAFSELRSQRTLLLEGDLRRPAFAKLFDRPTPNGLLQYLRGETDDIDSIVYPTVYDNLQFLPAGGKEFAHSTELLSSPRMHNLLDRLKDTYDHIFIDSPPVITVTDACILGANCDQTLLVIRLHKTPTEVVDRAKRLLRASNCEIAGVILTHMEMELSRYLYRYGYTYT